VSENSVGEAANLRILFQREAGLLRRGGRAFALNTRLDFAFANKIVSGASLNQDLKRKFSFEQA
jgi:hypothetical protein